jgi:drug/metabolite transporter (DMT)-like permease
MTGRAKGYLLDALLLLMTVIWGTNYTIIKTAFRELQPQAFNAMRMAVASAAFLAVIAAVRVAARRGARDAGAAASAGDIASIFHTSASVTAGDWLSLAALGVVGHVLYQYLFIGGLARTSVANSSLALAGTPVIIAILSAALGQERITRIHWLGAAVSLCGIYLVVGQGLAVGGTTLRGDLMMAGAVLCWAVFTLGARPLMTRHSPVGVTGLSMAIGTLIYVPLVWPEVRAVDWTAVTTRTWALLVYSALFALCVAYTIWYVGVRQIGSARTSVYSNLVPIVAMATAVLLLHEPIGLRKLAGAAAVLGGVALTRAGRRKRIPIPAQE